MQVATRHLAETGTRCLHHLWNLDSICYHLTFALTEVRVAHLYKVDYFDDHTIDIESYLFLIIVIFHTQTIQAVMQVQVPKTSRGSISSST